MKKHMKFYSVLLFILLVAGCVDEQPLENANEIRIGVVETMGDKKKSIFTGMIKN